MIDLSQPFLPSKCGSFALTLLLGDGICSHTDLRLVHKKQVRSVMDGIQLFMCVFQIISIKKLYTFSPLSLHTTDTKSR
jgi:hypothetical protein